uniref:Transcription factor CBF/NF-Y/archaeal histone domain-containing protein n=1 Tax=Setaria viridis TaxID=4556 RepID=A0A4U6V181_SETVI|nr:hypothetical protein SEVIR_4G191800v2 [Setaria viridis]
MDYNNFDCPRAGASCTMPTEPTAVAKEAAAAELPPVPSTEPPVIREQDRLMPVANVSRIMRRGLPPHAKISDDAKEVIQDCVSEFISFVTGEANERCHTEHRKTVTAEDLVWALDRLGFDDYVGPLNAFLQRMREIEGGGDGGRGSSWRGPRRGSSLQVALHSAQTIRPAVYRHPAYAVGPVPRPVPGSTAAARFGGRYQMPSVGGQRSMAPYYGGAAFQAGGSRHGAFYADEASSSNEAPPAPRAGSRH